VVLTRAFPDVVHQSGEIERVQILHLRRRAVGKRMLLDDPGDLRDGQEGMTVHGQPVVRIVLGPPADPLPFRKERIPAADPIEKLESIDDVRTPQCLEEECQHLAVPSRDRIPVQHLAKPLDASASDGPSGSRARRKQTEDDLETRIFRAFLHVQEPILDRDACSHRAREPRPSRAAGRALGEHLESILGPGLDSSGTEVHARHQLV
jgi:hypothetical protein